MYPCIIIPGFGQSKAELYENGRRVKQVWPLKADVKSIADKIKTPYLKTVLLRRDTGFTKAVGEQFAQILEPLATDENGNMKYDMRAVRHTCPLSECPEKVRLYVHKLVPIESLSKKIGDENIYFFAYNAFQDPYDTAKELDGFITGVKKEKGCDKVNLISFSMGGTVCTAYLDEYGKKCDIKKVFYVASALLGSQMQSDILERNFDRKQGYSLLEFFTSKSAGDAFRRVLAFVPWKVRYGVLYSSFDAVVDTAMMNSAGMWALQPVGDYKRLADKFLSDEKHAVLRKKTDRFFNAQSRLTDIISSLQSLGISFYCAAGYGLRMLPLSASGDVSSDSILSIYSSSLGAESAAPGEKLGKTGEFVSPDGNIDSSGCFLKDTTWLFNCLSHRDISHDARVGELIMRAFTDDGFKDVYSDESFPRFL